MASAARSTRAKRKKSTFRSQNGPARPWIGSMNNQCGCMDCRGRRFLF